MFEEGEGTMMKQIQTHTGGLALLYVSDSSEENLMISKLPLHVRDLRLINVIPSDVAAVESAFPKREQEDHHIKNKN